MHEEIKENKLSNSTTTTLRKVFQNSWSKEPQIFHKSINFKQCSLLAYTDSHMHRVQMALTRQWVTAQRIKTVILQ